MENSIRAMIDIGVVPRFIAVLFLLLLRVVFDAALHAKIMAYEAMGSLKQRNTTMNFEASYEKERNSKVIFTATVVMQYV